jgi:hypothetical protein
MLSALISFTCFDLFAVSLHFLANGFDLSAVYLVFLLFLLVCRLSAFLHAALMVCIRSPSFPCCLLWFVCCLLRLPPCMIGMLALHFLACCLADFLSIQLLAFGLSLLPVCLTQYSLPASWSVRHLLSWSACCLFRFLHACCLPSCLLPSFYIYFLFPCCLFVFSCCLLGLSASRFILPA